MAQTPQADRMLSERAQSLLKALVERYIADGQPVGSRSLSRLSNLELSPATIRNVMADLEEMGFVASPHTSAGRIPTPKGYRLFVDTLLTVRPMEELERQQLEVQLVPDDPHRMVSAASQIPVPEHANTKHSPPVRPNTCGSRSRTERVSLGKLLDR